MWFHQRPIALAECLRAKGRIQCGAVGHSPTSAVSVTVSRHSHSKVMPCQPSLLLIETVQQVSPVSRLDQKFGALAQFVIGDIAAPPSNFLRHTDLQTLALLD